MTRVGNRVNGDAQTLADATDEAYRDNPLQALADLRYARREEPAAGCSPGLPLAPNRRDAVWEPAEPISVGFSPSRFLEVQV